MADLVERVARAIGAIPRKAVHAAIDGQDYETTMKQLANMHTEQAKAAIDIVLEEAATLVVNDIRRDPESSLTTDIPPIVDRLNALAAAIRAMKGPTE